VLAAGPKTGLIVAAGRGAVEVLELQAPGAKRMGAREYLRGRDVPEGSILGRGG
jgi:methionyl-tRNA formyltransferase